MAIKLFQPASNPQSTKHYSSLRKDVNVINVQRLEEPEEFCTCIIQCVPCLPMFTDTIGTDFYKNDFFSLFQNSITGGSHEVYIVINGVQQPQITTNAYGKIFNMSANFGYRFDAFDIHALHGYCEWYGILINKDSLGNIVRTDKSPCFKLQRFTERAANRTVRIETNQQGKLLHGNNYSNLAPVVPGLKATTWFQQIRLPGALLLSGMPVENDGIVLNDSIRSRMQIMDKLSMEYDLELDLVSSEQVMFVILDYLFSNVCYVTDYNVYNWEKYRSKRLVRTGIDLQPHIRKRKSIVIKMKREEENIEKTND